MVGKLMMSTCLSLPIGSRHFNVAPGLPDFSWSKHTKTGKIYKKRPQTIPNGQKLYQIAVNIPNGHKVGTYSNILHSKVLQNLDFWLEIKPDGNPA
jgi:hypothetical protein